MREETSTQDLNERVSLIAKMIAEGRRSTESWGWTFLLWGVAYCVAVAWASWGGSASVWGHRYVVVGGVYSGVAWPVTKICAAILTLVVGIRKGKRQPGTTISRAIVAVWISLGISMLLIFPSLAMAGKLDEHSFVALVAAMLGAANGASGIILRWKAQIACAVVWWITSALGCFGSTTQLTVLFLTAVFICQILFGIYAMVLESRRRQHEIVHA
jgi:hypothetical protein